MDSLKSALLSSACVLLAAVALPAQAVTINDVYTGANDHGYGDVIGTLGSFAITDMDVTRSGNTLTVVINTNFAGMGDDGLFSGLHQYNCWR